MTVRPFMSLPLVALGVLLAAAPTLAQSATKPAAAPAGPTAAATPATATAAATAVKPAATAAAAPVPAPSTTVVNVSTTPGGPTVPVDIYMWVKMCNADQATKKEVCLTTQRMLSDTGEHVVTVTLREITGDPRSRQLMISAPLGMQLEPGIKAFVDKGKVLPMKYALCFTDGCYAQTAADDAFVKLMKSGGALNLTMVSPQGKPITVPISLANFTKVYSGKGVDAATAKLQFDILAQVTIAKAKAAGATTEPATKVN